MPTPKDRAHGGTLINVIMGLMFLVLIAYGVCWIMKTTGEAGEEYANTMIKTHHQASSVSCQMNLRSIGQTLQTYAISNDTYPASQQELISFAGYGSRLFHCPDPNGGEYTYIPGGRGDASRVVVYESKPAHDGRCNALLANGQVTSLTPEELQQAVSAAEARRR